MGRRIGGEYGALRVAAGEGGPGHRPPAAGWQYFTGGGEWRDDPSIAAALPSPPCTSLTVTIRGSEYSKYGGEYAARKKWYTGRQVGCHTIIYIGSFWYGIVQTWKIKENWQFFICL